MHDLVIGVGVVGWLSGSVNVSGRSVGRGLMAEFLIIERGGKAYKYFR